MRWVIRHWKDLLLVVSFVVVLCCLWSSAQSAREAWVFERLYSNTYKELVAAERNLELRYFESYGEMRSWVNDWVRDKFISVTGITSAVENFWSLITTGDYLWVCTDISEEMVRDARKDGYLVNECLVDDEGRVYGVDVSIFGNHMGVLAYCDGYYYFIEPQTSQIVEIVDRMETEQFLEGN